MEELKTDGRIRAAMSFVREGKTVADIGTDHGYIPIYLTKNGICPFCYASDVNRMPLEKAKSNAEKYGVADKIAFYLSDGLQFIDEGTDLAPTPDDIVIMGMGGELIVDILATSDYVKNKDVSLILQPMTMADKLRLYLAENGFLVTNEHLSEAAGKIYTVMNAHYDGERRTLTKAEALLGKTNIARGGELFVRYAEAMLAKVGKKRDGLLSGFHPAEEEIRLYNEIEEIIRSVAK